MRERRGACLHVACDSTTEVVTERVFVCTRKATLSFVEECEPEIRTFAVGAQDAEIVDVDADKKLVAVGILPIPHGFWCGSAAIRRRAWCLCGS